MLNVSVQKILGRIGRLGTSPGSDPELVSSPAARLAMMIDAIEETIRPRRLVFSLGNSDQLALEIADGTVLNAVRMGSGEAAVTDAASLADLLTECSRAKEALNIWAGPSQVSSGTLAVTAADLRATSRAARSTSGKIKVRAAVLADPKADTLAPLVLEQQSVEPGDEPDPVPVREPDAPSALADLAEDADPAAAKPEADSLDDLVFQLRRKPTRSQTPAPVQEKVVEIVDERQISEDNALTESILAALKGMEREALEEAHTVEVSEGMADPDALAVGADADMADIDLGPQLPEGQSDLESSANQPEGDAADSDVRPETGADAENPAPEADPESAESLQSLESEADQQDPGPEADPESAGNNASLGALESDAEPDTTTIPDHALPADAEAQTLSPEAEDTLARLAVLASEYVLMDAAGTILRSSRSSRGGVLEELATILPKDFARWHAEAANCLGSSIVFAARAAEIEGVTICFMRVDALIVAATLPNRHTQKLFSFANQESAG